MDLMLPEGRSSLLLADALVTDFASKRGLMDANSRVSSIVSQA